MRRIVFLGALCALVAVLGGCGGGEVVSPTPQTVVGTLLFTTNGCNSCHTYKPAGSTGTVGPDLDKLAADAQKANQGTLEEYTATSIKNPGGYVVPGFPNGVMPGFTQLTNQQLADLVAFLTQKS